MRTPLFLIAFGLLFMALLAEIGAAIALPGFTGSALEVARVPPDAEGLPAPGLAIPYVGLIDGLLLWVLGLMALALIVPAPLHARIQGAATLIAAVLASTLSVVLLFAAVTLLTIMVGLLLAPPFGTLIYLAVYGSFPLPAAQAVLGFAMVMKLASAGCLLAAHPGFLGNRSLMLLVLTSLAASPVVSLLHGLVPRVLASITDAVGAIVLAIVALVWMVAFAAGGIVSVVGALKPDPALA